ncbi:AIR synthase family protein [Promethearchaeum syntrophicum]|uniref:AIR synthase family protein n=1 Tax=Promethearchaeum syntrophicum TaxID=2594042 RepID=A0A5B9DFA2_9ARCH|nr:AIR synthase family protein [Candidatus Prometheoarchaeum syntrophicum]QEE17701.1 selenophosphate synthetase [Candidatus Prometheoarchaeum syntrophicum]
MPRFPPGKLPMSFMEKIIEKYLNPDKKLESGRKIIFGPHAGQDVAVIDIGDKYLVTKSDPITFTSESIGSYVVNINANDIVTSGAKPIGFQPTVLLPENKTDEILVDTIFSDMRTKCDEFGITITGGHTEITVGLDRPIICGMMWGEVKKEDLITTFGGKPGDALILTKGIAIEGSYIISKEKEKDLIQHNFNPQLIKNCQNLLNSPGISIVKEAQLLHGNFTVHAMHDPTEGGLAMGIVEMAQNSNCGVMLDYSTIPLISGTEELCKFYELDPFGLIASGALLVAVPKENVGQIVSFLNKNNIQAAEIGNLTKNHGIFSVKYDNGEIKPLKYSPIDEITKIY